ncbi:MAG: hypothetical protein MHMPM18_001713 [Marteilia pararefringens]
MNNTTPKNEIKELACPICKNESSFGSIIELYIHYNFDHAKGEKDKNVTRKIITEYVGERTNQIMAYSSEFERILTKVRIERYNEVTHQFKEYFKQRGVVGIEFQKLQPVVFNDEENLITIDESSNN